MQCGLSFSLMLDRREAMRIVLDQYDYRKIAKYKQNYFDRLMQTASLAVYGWAKPGL
ncbi:hypothetical protein DS743_02670 [Lactobacillus leichmannii]|uniref:Uncharacterized protein n=1 Tax=Lactobacillus leichmannii TaxID=28039 RepID=A0ABT1XVV3_LACLE|nr:Hypothetical protein LDBND_1085 [Lactobacillus delbrueckii subsp. bulgaricus ND02]MCR5970770.1 hypothetical protein [Lactobacillus leichmannii]MCT3475680.1 hypothetical protein [Lactobacillus delbrueckii subsp. lactis]